jgi:beta-N-acetylhexosaminidase
MSGASLSAREPAAAVFGCAGETLSTEEREFFRDLDPLGFILFQRNCANPDQVRALVDALRETVGRADAPVLIDQEGGRVARLRPPHWPRYPAPAAIASLGGEDASEAARLGARLIAADLAALGITIDCLPVLDVPAPGADQVIGDRAYGTAPGEIARLGRAVCEGLLEGGVLPVVKHIPGHGRGTVDSHEALPIVDAPLDALGAIDFAPFRALADMPWAMTAHIIYTAIDAARPATLSPHLIGETIRRTIGFAGVLVSDDLSMKALGGSYAERTAGALGAGCDLVLHCNGNLAEMREVATALRPLTPESAARVARGAARLSRPTEFDRAASRRRFDELMGVS